MGLFILIPLKFLCKKCVKCVCCIILYAISICIICQMCQKSQLTISPQKVQSDFLPQRLGYPWEILEAWAPPPRWWWRWTDPAWCAQASWAAPCWSWTGRTSWSRPVFEGRRYRRSSSQASVQGWISTKGINQNIFDILCLFFILITRKGSCVMSLLLRYSVATNDTPMMFLTNCWSCTFLAKILFKGFTSDYYHLIYLT